MLLAEVYKNNDARIEIDEPKQITLGLCDRRKLYHLQLGDQNWQIREIYQGLDPALQHDITYVVIKEDLDYGAQILGLV